MYLNLGKEIQHLVITLAMKSAPAAIVANVESLEKQRRKKAKNEKLLQEKNYEKMGEDFIIRFIYYHMSKTDACWRTTDNVKTKIEDIKKIKSKH